MPSSLSEHEFARLNTYIYLCDFGRFPHRKGKARENRTCAVLDLFRLRRDTAAPLNHTWFSAFSTGEHLSYRHLNFHPLLLLIMTTSGSSVQAKGSSLGNISDSFLF